MTTDGLASRAGKGLVALGKVAGQLNPASAAGAQVVSLFESRRTTKQLRLLEVAFEELEGDVERLVALFDDDRILELLTAALDAALIARSDEKIVLIARALGGTLRAADAGTDRIDAGQYLIDVLATMGHVDLLVLRHIASVTGGSDDADEEGSSLTPPRIADALASVGELVPVALQRLSSAGFVGMIVSNVRVVVTDAGKWVVRSLDELGSDPPQR